MTESSHSRDDVTQSEVLALRCEVAELKAEIRARLPRLIAVNIASMIGVSGLVLAAAKLA